MSSKITIASGGNIMAEMVRVALDAMGGDNAPVEIVKGAVDAIHKRSDIKVLLVGQENVVNEELAKK